MVKNFKKKNHFGGLNQTLSSWRITNNSLSSSILQKLVDGFKVYYKHMGYGILKSSYLLICLSATFLKKKYDN